ncbi:MAG: putative DNA-binding domain-containing protein [Polyangiaceae bacterium]
MQEALEATLAELVLGPALDSSDRGSLLAWLGERGVTADDARAIVETELPRLLTYRRLVRGTLREAVSRAIPRSLARAGSAFDAHFNRFLRERGPRTHYLRDVTDELLDFVDATAKTDRSLPAYWLDLARHEALHIEVAAAPALTHTTEATALDLDAGLAFSESVRLAHYEYAVHALPADVDDRSEPLHEPTHILAYRDAEHDVRYLELSALAAGVVERLLAGRCLRDSLLDAATSLGYALDASVLDASAALLSDLSERGVITGTSACPKSPEPKRTQHD